ncbi:hypothetical protein AMECASPLE_026711 [Ameca splendens]|uniref:Uncharacterized protein n=1 Tax=Ameca splendens TaxID=208324 RepID=A0ABV0Z2W7_9TELE
MVTVQRPSGEATQLVETKAPAVACAEKVSHPPAAVDTGEEGSRWSNGKDQLNEQRTVVEKISVEELTAAVGQMVLSKSHSRPFIKTFGRFWEQTCGRTSLGKLWRTERKWRKSE